VAERAALRPMLEQRYWHVNDHARRGRLVQWRWPRHCQARGATFPRYAGRPA
jgi:hypothetical protein